MKNASVKTEAFFERQKNRYAFNESLLNSVTVRSLLIL